MGTSRPECPQSLGLGTRLPGCLPWGTTTCRLLGRPLGTCVAEQEGRGPPPALVLPERLSSVLRDQGHRSLELGGFLGNVPSTCLVSQTWTARLRGKRGAARSPGESRGGGLEVAPEAWARCGSRVTYKRLSQSGNHKCHPGGPGAGDPGAHTGESLHASGFQSRVLGAARFNFSQAG